MQAHVDGKTVEYNSYKGCITSWNRSANPCWALDVGEYRIKPETLEEAAITYEQTCYTTSPPSIIRKVFIAGAKWQQEQSGESNGN